MCRVQTGGDRGRQNFATTSVGAWLLVVCWALVVVVLSIQAGTEELGRGRLRLDVSTLGHAVFFTILSFLVANAIAPYRPRRHWWWTIVLVSIFGIVDELMQSLVPLRSPSMADLFADVVGAFVGAIGWTVLARWQSGASLRRAVRVWRPRRPRRQVVQPKALDQGPMLTPPDSSWHAE